VPICSATTCWDRWRAGAGPLREPLTDAIGKLADVADRQLALLQQAATVQQPVTIHRPVSEQVDRPIVQARRDPPAALPEQPDVNVGPSPLFSQIQDDYIAIRENGGAFAGTISTARWRKARSGHWPETRIIRAQCKTLVQILGRPAHCLLRGLGAMLEVLLNGFCAG
jgi:hypothetical protein